jgi:hypothetical protein
LLTSLTVPIRHETIPEGHSTIGEARKRLIAHGPSFLHPRRTKWLRVVLAGVVTAVLLALVPALWRGDVLSFNTRYGTIVLSRPNSSSRPYWTRCAWQKGYAWNSQIGNWGGVVGIKISHGMLLPCLRLPC